MQREPSRIHQLTNVWGADKLAGYLVIILTSFAFALYTRTLDTQSLWFDEGLSVIFAARSPLQLIHTLVYEDLHPPLYYFVLHSWMRLAGSSEWAVRMPSAVAATLLVPLAFVVVREVAGEGRRPSWTWAAVAVAAAALVSTSPFIAYYAQEVRMYSMAAALSLATTWAFLKATRRTDRLPWCTFSCLLAASLYTQYFAAFIVPVFWLYSLLFDRRQLRRTVLSTLLTGFLYLPWLRPTYLQLGRLLRLPDYWISTRVSPRLFVRAVWTTFLPSTSIRLGFLVALFGAILLIRFGQQRKFRLSQRMRRSLLVVLVSAIPLALTYAAVTLAPKFVARYTIVAAAPLYICATLALYPLLSFRSTWARALFGLLIILAVGASLPSTMAVLEGRQNARDDVRGLASYLHQHARADDALLLVENAPYALQYYDRGPAPHYGLHVGTDFGPAAATLQHILQTRPRRVWLILWHHEFADPSDMITTELLRVGREAVVDQHFRGYQVRAFDILEYAQPIVAYPDPGTKVQADFAPGLHLTGFDRFANDSGRLHYVLYWQARQPLDRNYSLTLAFQDSQGNEYLRRDQALSTDYFLPPAWPTDTPIRGRVDLVLPADLPALTYRVYLQILDPTTQRNLDLVDTRGAPLGQALLLEELALSKADLAEQPAEIHSPLAADTGLGLELLGFYLKGNTYGAGDLLRPTLWWYCQNTPSGEWRVRFRLLDGQGLAAWEVDREVITGYPLTRWRTGEINRAIYRLTLPPDLPAGQYLLQTGNQAGWISLSDLHIVAREHRYDQPPMQQALDLQFESGVTLLGYDLSTATVVPGEATTVTLYWQAREPIAISYKVSVQMLSAGQRIAAQDDSIPAQWTYPTTAWLPGEIITDEHTLDVLPGAGRGSYTLIVVVYDQDSYERLTVEQAGRVLDHATLTTVKVAAQ